MPTGREKFWARIECECGAAGEAHYEENSNPAHHGWDLGTVIEGVSKPFKIVDGAVVCSVCNRTVRNA